MSHMRIQCLTHVTFEGPAAIGDWARKRGHELETIRADVAVKLPEPANFDILVIMGGPMSVNDDLPWQRRELAWVERVLHRGTAVFGVCLGAQILARIYGGRIYPAPEKEIGWWPVRRVCDPSSECPPLPSEFVPLHWHGETFDLPAGALHLAATDEVPNQGFALGHHVVGLQFHLEATPGSVEAIAAGAHGDITGGPKQQPSDTILKERLTRCTNLQPAVDQFLDWLAQNAATS